MKLYLPCDCTGDHFSFFAVLDMSESMQAWLLRLRSSFNELKLWNKELYKISFWDSSPDWYEQVEGFSPVLDQLGLACDVAALPDDFVLAPAEMMVSVEAARIECQQLIILEDGVRWQGSPKHTSELVDTHTIKWPVIQAKSKSQYKRVETQLHGRRRGKK